MIVLCASVSHSYGARSAPLMFFLKHYLLHSSQVALDVVDSTAVVSQVAQVLKPSGVVVAYLPK